MLPGGARDRSGISGPEPAMSLAREINDEAATAVSSETYTDILRNFVATSTECDKGE